MFRYRADRLPVLLVLLVFVADVSVFWFAERAWIPVLWCVAMAIPKGWICSFNHHHQHVPTFSNAGLNRLLELVYGFQTGVTSHAWFLHHVVGHHVHYLDQKVDQSRWARGDGSVMGEHEYAFKVAATAYPRAWVVGRKYPRARRVFAAMLVIHAVLLVAGALVRPWNTLWVFAVPMAVSLYLTAWATYFHHAGLHTEDPHEACYNILHPAYNLMTGNLGYHTAHHLKHGLHWSELPALHRELERRIPTHLYRQPGIPFVWFGTERKISLDEARATAGS